MRIFFHDTRLFEAGHQYHFDEITNYKFNDIMLTCANEVKVRVETATIFNGDLHTHYYIMPK